MTAPTPSAPTAEVLAQEARQLEPAETDREIELLTIIDRLAALARSEPPTGEPSDAMVKAGVLEFLTTGKPGKPGDYWEDRVRAMWKAMQAVASPTGGPVASDLNKALQAWINAALTSGGWYVDSRGMPAAVEARAPVAIPEGKMGRTVATQRQPSVPREPTEWMQDRGAMEIAMLCQRVQTAERSAEQVWRAMWDAALATPVASERDSLIPSPIEAQAGEPKPQSRTVMADCVVYVCPEKDIVCPDNRRLRCDDCPRPK